MTLAQIDYEGKILNGVVGVVSRGGTPEQKRHPFFLIKEKQHLGEKLKVLRGQMDPKSVGKRGHDIGVSLVRFWRCSR